MPADVRATAVAFTLRRAPYGIELSGECGDTSIAHNKNLLHMRQRQYQNMTGGGLDDAIF